MQPAPVIQGTQFPWLHVLVPPLRLVSAAIWQTVQHRIVTAYGLLDDVITEITEIVPGLLNCRQRCLLCLHLQAQLVLDMCRPGQTIDTNTLQPHLDRMQILISLLDKEVNISAEGMSGPYMLLCLIQRLITDPDKRQHFYQDVFPVRYGPKYCKAVELLVMKFLVELEQLLVVPNLQQVAYMLGSAPSVLAECVELPLSRELKSLLEYQKDSIKPSNIDVLHAGDSGFGEETLLKANMLDDYMEASGRQQTVEMATAENASRGSDTKDKMSGGVCVTIQPSTVKLNSQKEVACNIKKMVPSRRLHVDTCAVKIDLGCNIEVPENIGHTGESISPAIATVEDEQVYLSERTDGHPASDGQSSACINMKKDIAVKTMECSPANEHLRNTNMSKHVEPASSLAREEAPALTGLAIRPVRKNRGLKMKEFLMTMPKTESEDTLVSKPRRTYGRTSSRSPDMRRPQGTHTRERLFQCPLCEKYFQFQHDLEQHNSSVCRVAGPPPGTERPQTTENKTADDLSQGSASSAQHLKMTDQENEALHPRGTCQGTQSLRSKEEESPVTQRERSSSQKEIPSAAVHNTSQPNQAVLKHKTIMERSESTVLRGSGAIGEDKCQVKQNQTRQGSEPAAKSIKPIPIMLTEASLLEGNFCSNKEKQPIQTTEAKDTNSTLCVAAVKETPRSRQRPSLNTPPFVCPNCEVKFKSKSALRRHMMTACKVEKMTPMEADAAIQRCKTLKENKGRKCTGEPKQADSAFSCTECDMSFPDRTRFVTHNLIHQPRSCTMCDETFSGFSEVNRHYVDAHQFRGPFPCALCKRVYPGLKGLIRHERAHTGDLPFQCAKCPKAFFYASGLKLHDRTHTKEAPFLCWDCGRGCRSNSALKTHRLCCHGGAADKRFRCEHCGASYALKRSCDLHAAKVHAGVRYPCAHCGKLFRSASSLTRHDLTHTQERPFSCKDCRKGFRSASELKIHARYHTGERPFKCQECGKGFVQSYYLTAHMRMHSGEKPYRCPACDKCFKSAATLKRHRMTHTGEKPHMCSVCGTAFSRNELLKSHQRKSHAK